MKQNRYKVVITGFAHVHINDVAAHFYDHPRIHLSACADTVPLVTELKSGPYTRAWNLAFCSGRFQLKVYEDWMTMLDQEKPDLCVVNSENAYHAQITEACAQRGIDVCLEKPMALSLSEGLAMYRAAKTYGTEIIVNWPITWNPGMRTIKRLLEAGTIGDIIEAHVLTVDKDARRIALSIKQMEQNPWIDADVKAESSCLCLKHEG